MSNTKLLSICIPTNGAVQFVLPVLESIYTQGVDDNLFEVVITDNGKDSLLESSLDDFRGHDNLHYYKSESQGFVNQVDSFKRSNGLYIKMLNHRAKLLPGALDAFIQMVKKYQDTQPCIYCSDGVLKNPEYTECKDFNEFVRDLSIYSSWSAGVGIWQKDKSVLDSIEYNKMFPHASILFETRVESKYVIWNRKFMEMGAEPTKGGYNLFHTFAVVYLDLLKNLQNRGRITSVTFNCVKKDLRDFLSDWYYNIFIAPNLYSFYTEDYKKHILVYYNKFDLLYIKMRAGLRKVLHNGKQTVRKLWA